MAAAQKRPEIAGMVSTFLPSVPQQFVDVDREKVLKQGVPLNDVYRTIQAFMGGLFVNYFNRFGRQWQVYVEAEGEYRTNLDNMSQFYVRNGKGDMVPLSSLVRSEPRPGPEFTMRYNLYRSAQIVGSAAPGYSSATGDEGAGRYLRQNHAARDGLRLHGHVVPGKEGAGGCVFNRDLRILAAVRFSDSGRAVRELVACPSACC